MTIEPENQHVDKCAQLIVHGRVQGVGFRYFAQATATRYGVAGWVRNHYNGTVEIWAEGHESALAAFIDVMRRGPAGSHVSNLDVQWHTPLGKYTVFNIRA